AKKEGHEPSCLEKFRFQHLWKDVSDKLSSEVAEQVYVRNKWDEACKRVKDSMPTPKSSFEPQDNIALENEVYTQVFGPDNDEKMLGYGSGMTKSRLFGYGSVTCGSQSTSTISTLIEEMSTKHVKQIQTIQAEQAIREKTLLEEAKLMDIMDACEKKYRALLNECMAKGMSREHLGAKAEKNEPKSDK
ncbi:hypothetical protein Gohar_013591, partial [Gossypium harknessii]|nr:hypothetical protein [Gossypium harknessii]